MFKGKDQSSLGLIYLPNPCMLYVVYSMYIIYNIFHRSSPKGISIVAGTLEHKKPGQTREAVKITIHEAYSPSNSYINDVALIKINTSFEFNDKVQPVPLPDPHTKIVTNSTGVVSGWGRLGGVSILLCQFYFC